MPKYFIQGRMAVEPASHPDDVKKSLNRHGAELTGSNANLGGAIFWAAERVEARTPEAAIAELKFRIDSAAEHRRRTDAVQRFAVSEFVAEFISEWLADDEFGAPELGPVRQLAAPS